MEYTEEKILAIGKVLEDEGAVEALRSAQDKQEIIRIFSEKGAEIDEVAAQAAFEKINSIRENGGELSEEDLELVSGGAWKVLAGMAVGGYTTYKLAQAGVAAAAFGGPIGVGIGVGCLVMAGLTVAAASSKKKK